jgi:hypothetical protein
LRDYFYFSSLTIMLVAGAVGIGGALVASVGVVVAWALGAIDVRGDTALMLAVLFSSSTMLLALGIVGGYVWRIFENTKGRPAPIVHSVEEFAANRAGAAATRSSRTARPGARPAARSVRRRLACIPDDVGHQRQFPAHDAG